MKLDAIIARAAPPPERVGGPFEPVRTDAGTLERRRRRMIEAFGSREALAAYTEPLGVEPDVWLAGLGDVRLAGEDPEWAAVFRAVHGLVGDGDYPFAGVRRWAKARLTEDWPPSLSRGPDALEGHLNQLAERLGPAVRSLMVVERRLGVTSRSWEQRFELNPVLAWIFGQVIADWFEDVITMMRRAAEDRPLYAPALLGVPDPGRLLTVDPGLGDPHDGGRSVAILRFERGSVVYKPKDLRIAAVFGEVAAEVGEPGIAGPVLLLRDGYAWEAEERVRPLGGREDGAAFYGALGGWLALLQGLGAVDFWFDNLIADGATPRFVDFETVAQPLSFPLLPPDNALADRLRIGPETVGILPLFSLSGDGTEPTDLGCLTRPGKHRLPRRVAGANMEYWEESRFAPRLPSGEFLDVADFFEAFEEGYLRVARTLRQPEAQSRLLRTLRRSADAPIRIIMVDTWSCYAMVRRSLRSDRLGDAVWREIDLHAIVTESAPRTTLRTDIVTDLRRLDVPLFQTRLNSRDLFGTRGGRHRNVFPLDALSEAPKRLEALARASDEERLRLLRSNFALRAGNPPRHSLPPGRVQPASSADLLEWADGIAADLEDLPFAGNGGRPVWTGFTVEPFSGWRGLGPLRLDVLTGSVGLALALLELAPALGRPQLTALACETLRSAARDCLDAPVARDNGGFVVGVGGLVVALARAPGLVETAREVYAAAAEEEIWMRSGGGIVSGLAGWRRAAAEVGEPAPERHGSDRALSPAALPRLAPWLDPAKAVPVCPDREAAARLWRSRERHGVWFAHLWQDDRHHLSGVDGLPALATSFVRLANGADATEAIPDYLR